MSKRKKVGRLDAVWSSYEFIYKGWRRYLVNIAGFIGVVGAIYSMWKLSSPDMTQSIAKPYVFIWALAPPIWFFCEYYLLFNTQFNDKDDQEYERKFERFKHGQDVARNLWAATGVLLGVLYSTLNK